MMAKAVLIGPPLLGGLFGVCSFLANRLTRRQAGTDQVLASPGNFTI
jgi:hypothetical protein